MWHTYVKFAVLKHNTSYHTNIGSQTIQVFHERVPYNVLDLKMGIFPQKWSMLNSQTAQHVNGQTEMFFQDERRTAMQAFIRYQAYYDKKGNASKLKQPDSVYVLQSKAHHQGINFLFTDFRWSGPYIVEKLYKKTANWHARLDHIKRKSFIACNYDRSRLKTPYVTYRSRHRHGSLTLRLSVNKMNCTPEHGSLILERLFLTTIKMSRAQLTHVKWQ